MYVFFKAGPMGGMESGAIFILANKFWKNISVSQ
jgi:hypothetical protein